MDAAVQTLPDGIYFGLEEDIYFAQNRMSSTAVKNLLVSPATFWARSWLNADKKDKRDPMARNVGKAYHTSRFEPEKMNARFIRSLDKSKHPAAVTSSEMVGKLLAKYGQTKRKGGESIYEQAERLKRAGHRGEIFCLIKRDFEAGVGERTVIPHEVWDEIVQDGERLRSNADIKELVTNGVPEVSVLWTDEVGIKWKCRFDYLKADKYTDLKTFANSNDKVLMNCLADIFRYYRHYIQGAIYYKASEAIRLVDLPMFGGDLKSHNPASAWEHRVIEEIRKRELPISCYFLYQEKDAVPNILAKRFKPYNIHYSDEDAAHLEADDLLRLAIKHGHKSGLYIKAEVEINRAIEQFKRYSEIYSEGEPWLPIEAVTDFDDDDFNQYWLEGKNQ